jgi:hypothetical protein
VASNGVAPDATLSVATDRADAIVITAPGTTPAPGSRLTLSISSPLPDAAVIQWQKRRASDGAWIDVDQANGAGFDLPSVQRFHAGDYRVVVTVAGVTFTSGSVRVVVPEPVPSDARLLNISTRALDLTGDDVLIPGFVIAGTGTKRMLVRAVGPGLHDIFGLTGTLADPQISLRNQTTGTIVASNDDWGDSVNKAGIISTSASVGAFDLLEPSKDAVILVDLPAGSYTAPAPGVAEGTGIAIVELYDADVDAPSARLVNFSNRGYVGTGGEIMIPGFVVSPEGSRTFLIRAVGPTLANFSVDGLLEDPVLTVFSHETPILANDDWGVGADAAQTATVATVVGAFPLSTASKDAAFVVTLPPGAYTIHASGKNGSTGVALVEVYLVP